MSAHLVEAGQTRVTSYRWEIAQCEDGEETRLSACAVADDHQLPGRALSALVGGTDRAMLHIPPHNLLVLLRHFGIYGQPNVFVIQVRNALLSIASRVSYSFYELTSVLLMDMLYPRTSYSDNPSPTADVRRMRLINMGFPCM